MSYGNSITPLRVWSTNLYRSHIDGLRQEVLLRLRAQTWEDGIGNSEARHKSVKRATVPGGEIKLGAKDTEGVRPKKRVRACVEQLSAIPTQPPYCDKG